MLTMGVDVGSRTVKAVVWDADARKVLGHSLMDAGPDPSLVAVRAADEALDRSGRTLAKVAHTIATGYGRSAVRGRDESVTEITCHAVGAAELFPCARTVIDIGGQDSKVIRLEDGGAVLDFIMNDRCAAGTGRFLELASQLTGVGLADLGTHALSANGAVEISSMCVVFAESEIHGLLAQQTPVAEILAGVHRACAARILGFAERLGVEEDVVMTGGVAHNQGIAEALSEGLGVVVHVPPNPQLVGALGAAVLAAARAAGG